MLTADQLAELLSTVNVDEVAREAGVSTKTIYRLRHKANSPTLDTVAAILAAIDRVNARTAEATA